MLRNQCETATAPAMPRINADGEQLHAVRKNQVLDLETLRAEREADADFPQASQRGVGNDPIEADRGQAEREQRENREQKSEETMHHPRFLDALLHRRTSKTGCAGSIEATISRTVFSSDFACDPARTKSTCVVRFT